MPSSIRLLLALATLPCGTGKARAGSGKETAADLQDLSAPVLEHLYQRVEQFCQQRVTPTEMYRFEKQLQEDLRELGRTIAQWTYNRLEPPVNALPKHVWFEAGPYTRLNQKTPQNAWTLFGQVRLWRVGYRPTNKTGDATLFPLALSLGLVHGATPALAERAARLLGGSGMTQSQTLEQLRHDHGVGWGVPKLRQVTAAVSQAMAEQRHEAQVAKLLELLEQARASRGRHKQAQASAQYGPGWHQPGFAGAGWANLRGGDDGNGDGVRPTRQAAGYGLPGLYARVRPGHDESGVGAAGAGSASALAGPSAAPLLCHGRGGQRNVLLRGGAAAYEAASTHGGTAALDPGSGLLPRERAHLDDGGPSCPIPRRTPAAMAAGAIPRHSW